jgi:Tfp pilus assembly protein PilZ
MAGAFIATDAPLPVKTRISLQVTVPDKEAPLVVCGEVRWVREPGEATKPGGEETGEPPGVGVMFVHGSEAEQAAFEEQFDGLIRAYFGDEIYGVLLQGFGV